jgi:hypothetical protein
LVIGVCTTAHQLTIPLGLLQDLQHQQNFTLSRLTLHLSIGCFPPIMIRVWQGFGGYTPRRPKALSKA